VISDQGKDSDKESDDHDHDHTAVLDNPHQLPEDEDDENTTANANGNGGTDAVMQSVGTVGGEGEGAMREAKSEFVVPRSSNESNPHHHTQLRGSHIIPISTAVQPTVASTTATTLDDIAETPNSNAISTATATATAADDSIIALTTIASEYQQSASSPVAEEPDLASDGRTSVIDDVNEDDRKSATEFESQPVLENSVAPSTASTADDVNVVTAETSSAVSGSEVQEFSQSHESPSMLEQQQDQVPVESSNDVVAADAVIPAAADAFVAVADSTVPAANVEKSVGIETEQTVITPTDPAEPDTIDEPTKLEVDVVLAGSELTHESVVVNEKEVEVKQDDKANDIDTTQPEPTEDEKLTPPSTSVSDANIITTTAASPQAVVEAVETPAVELMAAKKEEATIATNVEEDRVKGEMPKEPSATISAAVVTTPYRLKADSVVDDVSPITPLISASQLLSTPVSISPATSSTLAPASPDSTRRSIKDRGASLFPPGSGLLSPVAADSSPGTRKSIKDLQSQLFAGGAVPISPFQTRPSLDEGSADIRRGSENLDIPNSASGMGARRSVKDLGLVLGGAILMSPGRPIKSTSLDSNAESSEVIKIDDQLNSARSRGPRGRRLPSKARPSLANTAAATFDQDGDNNDDMDITPRTPKQASNIMAAPLFSQPSPIAARASMSSDDAERRSKSSSIGGDFPLPSSPSFGATAAATLPAHIAFDTHPTSPVSEASISPALSSSPSPSPVPSPAPSPASASAQSPVAVGESDCNVPAKSSIKERMAALSFNAGMIRPAGMGMALPAGIATRQHANSEGSKLSPESSSSSFSLALNMSSNESSPSVSPTPTPQHTPAPSPAVAPALSPADPTVSADVEHSATTPPSEGTPKSVKQLRATLNFSPGMMMPGMGAGPVRLKPVQPAASVVQPTESIEDQPYSVEKGTADAETSSPPLSDPTDKPTE
jgi:hypothetical protein